LRIVESKILNSLKFMKVFVVSYLDRKGQKKEWQMVSRCNEPKCISGNLERPDAAIIVPYHRKQDKLVVIREFRVPIGAYQYGFPAGLLDSGEELIVSARRELFEETGLQVVKVYRHSPAIFSSAGITDESIAMVFVEVDGSPNGANLQDSEEIEVFLMSRTEVGELLGREHIAFGARAWLAMDAFVRSGVDYLTGDPSSHF
jgi:ADP-ribose pyrophosphatase